MSDIKKIRVGGVDYNISPNLSNYAKKTDLTGYAKKTEIDSLISEVQTKEYYYNDGSNEVVPVKWPDLSTQPSILPYKFMGQYVYEQLIPIVLDGTITIGAGSVDISIKHFAVNKPIFLSSDLIGEGIINPLSNTSGITYNNYLNSYVCSFTGKEYINTNNNYKYIHVVYTSMPEEGGDYYYGSDSNNHEEYVDLGLPSGLKWAKCNVGANSESDYGLYFAWGETVGYSESDVRNGIHSFITENYKFEGVEVCDGKYTKYDSSDNKITLEFSDDAASVNMGGSWRMPSKKEYEELIDNTTNTWTTINGVKGRLFTGNNGNTLFFPAAGYCHGSWVSGDGSCHYWSYSLYSNNPRKAYSLSANNDSDNCRMGEFDRFYGLPVRGVIE